MDTDKLKAMLEEADEAWTNEDQPPPFSLYVAKRFYLAGLEAARGECEEQKNYKGHVLPGASQAASAINQLITEARQ